MRTATRKKRSFTIRRLLPVAIVIAILFVVFSVRVVRENISRTADIGWGVTFSTKYAKELGVDWRQAFLATLDELGVRRFRIPVHWDEVQPTDGPYDFRDVDWMLEEAGRRDAQVILVIGRRVPRWPECHTPGWAKALHTASQRERVLDLITAEVGHFKNSDSVVAWQLENEPLLDVFGVCPSGSISFLREERRLLKKLDQTRPVVVTDSGELSAWIPTAFFGDVLGISMYRVTWNKWFGYFYYPITPAFYQQRAVSLYPIIKKVIITELQAEPWPASNRPITQTSLDEQYKSMNLRRFRNNIEFARRVGFSEVYLWGVEWWYWIREKGDPSFWNEAMLVF